MYSVLLVEDLAEAQLTVKRALANADIQLTIASTVEEALALVSPNAIVKYHLVILDLFLPDGEGLKVLEDIRSGANGNVPVFLLTSQTELDSKVMAFNLGADDYLIKPISGVELRARVEMRLKRTAATAMVKSVLQKGALTLDVALLRASLQTSAGAKILPLTGKEFKILALLVQNEGRVYSRQDLVRSVWGDSVHVLERTVDSHIFGLRKKLGSSADYIESIAGMGYRFITTESKQDAVS